MKKIRCLSLALIALGSSSLFFNLTSCNKQDEHDVSKTFIVTSNLMENQGILSNSDATLNQDFNTDIFANQNYEIDSIEVFTNDKNLIVNQDFSYSIVESQKASLKIFGRAIVTKNLNIRVIFKNFNITFKSNDGKAAISTLAAKINQDFNASFDIQQFYTYSGMVIRSHSKLLTENNDFLVRKDKQIVHLLVFGNSIVDNDLNIDFFTSKKYFNVNFNSIGGEAHSSNLQFYEGRDFETILTMTWSPDLNLGSASIFESLSVSVKTRATETLLIPGQDYTYTCDDYAVKLKVFWSEKIKDNLNITMKMKQVKSITNNCLKQNLTFLQGLVKDVDVSSFDTLYIFPHINQITENAFLNTFTVENKKTSTIHSLVFSNTDNLRVIENNAFNGCTSLSESLKIPTTIKTIGDNAFANCTNLEMLDFSDYTDTPQWITKDNNGIFANVSKKGYIVADPKYLDRLQVLFEKCQLPNEWRFVNSPISDEKLLIDDDVLNGFNKDYDITDTTLLKIPSNISKINEEAFSSYKDIRNSSIHDLFFNTNLIEIGASAFKGCKKIDSHLWFRDKLETIGASAFEDCTQINEIISFGSSLKNIGDNAFQNCNNILGDIIFPSTIEKIGNFAFHNCKKIKKVFIPKKLLNIGYGVFDSCESIDTIDLTDFDTIDEKTHSWIIEPRGIFRSVSTTGTVLIKAGSGLTEKWKDYLTKNAGLPSGWNFKEI